ncbi:MAG: MFS transporter [Kribbellaceae bacterium]
MPGTRCATSRARIRSASQRDGHGPLLPPSLVRLPSMRKGLSMILAFSIGFGAFMFVFALMVQRGLHADPLHSGLAILPMALLFFVGSVVSPKIISRYGRGALPTGALVQVVGLGALVAVVVAGWPNVRLPQLAIPLALAGAGQSLVFAGLFRVVLTDCPPHLAGAGGGVLITIQQSGLALGVATLGSLFVAMETTNGRARIRRRGRRADGHRAPAGHWQPRASPTSSVRQVERIRHPLALHSDAMRRQFLSWSMVAKAPPGGEGRAHTIACISGGNRVADGSRRSRRIGAGSQRRQLQRTRRRRQRCHAGRSSTHQGEGQQEGRGRADSTPGRAGQRTGRPGPLEPSGYTGDARHDRDAVGHRPRCGPGPGC